MLCCDMYFVMINISDSLTKYELSVYFETTSKHITNVYIRVTRKKYASVKVLFYLNTRFSIKHMVGHLLFSTYSSKRVHKID